MSIKSITIFSLAILLVCTIIYTGADIMLSYQKLGLLFIFVGGCTAVGLGIDIFIYVKERIRKDNLRKLGIKN